MKELAQSKIWKEISPFATAFIRAPFQSMAYDDAHIE
jgi:hypothetical protein